MVVAASLVAGASSFRLVCFIPWLKRTALPQPLQDWIEQTILNFPKDLHPMTQVGLPFANFSSQAHARQPPAYCCRAAARQEVDCASKQRTCELAGHKHPCARRVCAQAGRAGELSVGGHWG